MSDTKKPDRAHRPRVIVVTGLSGAGKSTALHVFEDQGFEAVDNLPISLLPRLLQMGDGAEPEGGLRPLAIGIDSRTRAFDPAQVLRVTEDLRRWDAADVTLLFMECDDDNLVKRFSETRRKHPLALDRPVLDGITAERAIMGPLKEAADIIIDTSGNTVHEAKHRVKTAYDVDEEPHATIIAKSFGYGRGLPRDADLVFDVRFLKNPHYVEELRPLTGCSLEVAEYVKSDENFAPFFNKMSKLLQSLLPLYRKEGKAYLTIAFGCTGGRHRSVTVAEAIGKLLDKEGYRVNIVHRDIRPN